MDIIDSRNLFWLPFNTRLWTLVAIDTIRPMIGGAKPAAAAAAALPSK